MTDIQKLYQDLAMLDDMFQALENLEHEVKSNTLSIPNEKLLAAFRSFHTNWLKDQ